VVPDERAVPLPEGASAELGASLGVPAMTAHRCLFADGPLEGKTVLVAGGAGAVGHYAIELAKHAGARVISTVSGPEKAELAAKAGADLVVNYREPGAADQVSAFAGAAGVDHVVEVALGANLQLDLAVVARPDARIVCYAAEPSDPALPARACMNLNLRQAARDITAALADGALTELPVVKFPLDEIAEAHEAVERGAVGKVLVIPG
jgi:NADPH2:quinone reductase